MNIIDQIAEAFRKTYDDQVLSKSERKALRQLIDEAGLDQRKRDVLRAKIFDIAREGIKKGETYFTMDWLEDASRLLIDRGGAEKKVSSSVYFSPGEACLDAIITQIQGARNSLDICVFTISDDRISNALKDRHSRGLGIRIITDNDKLYDSGSDIQSLAGSGIEVRVDNTSNHMHHKFAVMDGGTVITGSYNWTRSAAKYNEENILVTQEKVIVDRYRDEFKDLWKKMSPL